MIETSRRSLLIGAASLLAAPAIVRASSLMPVKVMSVPLSVVPSGWTVTTDGLVITIRAGIVEAIGGPRMLDNWIRSIGGVISDEQPLDAQFDQQFPSRQEPL
jgi:hypothetical protein